MSKLFPQTLNTAGKVRSDKCLWLYFFRSVHTDQSIRRKWWSCKPRGCDVGGIVWLWLETVCMLLLAVLPMGDGFQMVIDCFNRPTPDNLHYSSTWGDCTQCHASITLPASVRAICKQSSSERWGGHLWARWCWALSCCSLVKIALTKSCSTSFSW